MWGLQQGGKQHGFKRERSKIQNIWGSHTTPALLPALPIIECCSQGILHLLPAGGGENQRESRLPGAGNVKLIP